MWKCFRCAGESIGPASGRLQHRTGGGSHRHQNLRRCDELPRERLRSVAEGKSDDIPIDWYSLAEPPR